LSICTVMSISSDSSLFIIDGFVIIVEAILSIAWDQWFGRDVLQSVDEVDQWPAGMQCSSIIIAFQRKGSKRQLEVSIFQRMLPRGTKRHLSQRQTVTHPIHFCNYMAHFLVIVFFFAVHWIVTSVVICLVSIKQNLPWLRGICISSVNKFVNILISLCSSPQQTKFLTVG